MALKHAEISIDLRNISVKSCVSGCFSSRTLSNYLNDCTPKDYILVQIYSDKQVPAGSSHKIPSFSEIYYEKSGYDRPAGLCL